MWIKHIYGVPDSYTDVFAAPLGDLVDQVPESHFNIFSHPVIQQVVSLKWLAFARKRVLAENLLQLQHVIIFTMFDRSADTPNMSTHVHKVSRVLWVASSFLLLSVTLYTASVQIRSKTMIALDSWTREVFTNTSLLDGCFPMDATFSSHFFSLLCISQLYGS